MLNHSENWKWVPIGKGYTNPTLEMPRRKFSEKVLRCKIPGRHSGNEAPGNISSSTDSSIRRKPGCNFLSSRPLGSTHEFVKKRAYSFSHDSLILDITVAGHLLKLRCFRSELLTMKIRII